MMLELIFLDGVRQGETIRLTFEKAWFGRQPTCDFVLPAPTVSRVHFSIQKRGDDYALLDNKSTNVCQWRSHECSYAEAGLHHLSR
jgi:pSer/pThr/pTyr-binding forkhead associated (FHA) protein